MKTSIVVSLLALGQLLAQTPSNRPSVTAFTSFNTKQVKLTSLTSAGFSYRPTAPSPNNQTGDVYMGDNKGNGWLIAIGAISGSVVITLQDNTGFLYGSGWTFTSSNAATTFPLTYLNGSWLQQGFKFSCTDGASGANCALVEAFLTWLE